MKAELKQKWIDALRSGLYEQARGALMDEAHGELGVRYCCLGVLIGVSGQYRPAQLRERGLNQDYTFVEGLVGGSEMRGILAGLNDFERKSFTEIADYIEQRIPVDA